MRLLLVPLAAVLLVACEPPPPTAQGDADALALIERSRARHGSDALDQAEIRFSFRGTPFVLRRDGATFRYARTLEDGSQTVEEVVDNDGVHRFVDGVEVEVSPDEAERIDTAVNSVAYFMLLPAPLTDGAVRARSLGADSVGGASYDRVEVTFAQEGGGFDYQDRYVYWLRDDGQIGHFAYSYEPNPADTSRNETGTRFRVPISEQRVDGVLFQDWRNLSADSLDALEDFGDAYDAGLTFDISEVVLDSIRITPL